MFFFFFDQQLFRIFPSIFQGIKFLYYVVQDFKIDARRQHSERAKHDVVLEDRGRKPFGRWS